MMIDLASPVHAKGSRSQSEPNCPVTSVVQTGGGDMHYIKKQVAFGVKGIQEEEPVSPAGVAETAEFSLTRGEPKRRSNKKRKSSRSNSDGNLALQLVQGSGGSGELGLSLSLPPRGEPRHVYLDMKWQRFGFQLKNYSRRSEDKQTIVQSVAAGSPAFMAGLHPGDCILEVNGQDVSSYSVTEVVTAIMETGEKRVQLLVKYIDGARLLDLKKKRLLTLEKLTEKQSALKKLLSNNRSLLTTYLAAPATGRRASSEEPISTFKPLFPECAAKAINGASQQPLHCCSFVAAGSLSPTDSNNADGNDEKRESSESTSCIHRNISIYMNSIQHISCDVLVLPLDSKNQPRHGSAVMDLLRLGGDKLMNELALARQPALGNVIITTGGKLRGIGHIYHCIIGHFEEHIRQCCKTALEKSLACGAGTVVFWIDGFVSCHVPPTLLLECIRGVLEDNLESFKRFRSVVFAGQAMPEFSEYVSQIFLK